MSAFTKILEGSEEFVRANECIEKGKFPAGIIGLSQVHKAHYITALAQKNNTKAVIVCPDENSASKLCEDLNVFDGGALLYPARDFHFTSTDSRSFYYQQKRIGVLSRILEDDFRYIVCSVEAAAQLTIPFAELEKRSLRLDLGQEIPPEKIIELLSISGYTRAEQVEGVGQFSQRGGILDIFSPGQESPARIEFWGDSIDSLALFDPVSQRRKDNLPFLKIMPCCEILFESTAQLQQKLRDLLASIKGKGALKARESVSTDLERLDGGFTVSTDRYLSLAYEKPETLFDYTDGCLLFVSETSAVKQKFSALSKLFLEDLKILSENGTLFKGIDTFQLSWEQLLSVYKSRQTFYTDNLARGSFDTPVKELVSVYAQPLARWNGTLSYLEEDLAPLQKNKYTTVLFAGTDKSARELAFDLENDGYRAVYFPRIPEEFPPQTVSVIPGCISAGMEYSSIKFALFSYGKSSDTAKPVQHFKRSASSKRIISLEDLHRGDYVVHVQYGIGIFDGIHTQNISGKLKDFIKINYRGNDVLHLPVTQLDMLSKYMSPKDTDKVIKLNKLFSDEWTKTKSKVRSSVRDMADELTALYAKRLGTKGYAFSPDIDMQNDFERRFEFEETDDQLQAIYEIKKDMESSVPMDRLLCGDVGFGKTEVALRAAFKCIADGKQCAILVPTTILAFQHFQTIKKRFDGFPVEIEMLSRFRTPKDSAQVKKRLKRGSVDIVVGTHSIIASSVEFKDLGLLIIDEEQRFGVAQKEKLKEKFPQVDVLTLSATPIPRTLNMAMTGIRDMSVLEVAPTGRHPVQSYVIPHDMQVLAEAIDKEIRRGGQVYYLLNRIDSLESRSAQIRKFLPDARIGIAHGQMTEQELSLVWRQLLENEIDVLICTTIIETGVDVPNANTLIIENADTLGLAQLHQIRGRVGRSSRRAYAYFTYKKNKVISEIAQRRLSAIREYTQFGSGFKIAMRDLEIRGAGSVLGARQHGHMEAVGYDMYLQILSQVLESQQTGEPVKQEKNCLLDLAIDAHIPKDYVTSVKHRIGMYKRIAEISNSEDAIDVIDEFFDRFGEPPKAVEGLVQISLLRANAAELGIYEIRQNEAVINVFLDDMKPEYILAVNESFRRNVSIRSGKVSPIFSINLQKNQTTIDVLKELITVLSKAKADAEKNQTQQQA